VARREPLRNRVMLALAYDAALRREELCSLRTDDVDSAHRTLRIRSPGAHHLVRPEPYSNIENLDIGDLSVHQRSQDVPIWAQKKPPRSPWGLSRP
jgi:integrase/recombinase XerD